jgi:hypothetical protein
MKKKLKCENCGSPVNKRTPKLCTKCAKEKKHNPLALEILLVGLLLILILPLCSASLGYIKTGDCISIRVLANCSSVDLIEVTNSNQTFLINSSMNNIGGQTFNYSFCDTQLPSLYTFSWNNPCVDCSQGDCGNSFIVNDNGKEPASGGVIVFFSILFLIFVGITIYLAIYTLGHLVALDFDIIDLAFDWGVFFVIVTFYFLEGIYLGNLGIESYLLWFISIGGIILVLVPIIAFILSITVGSLSRKNWSLKNIGVPQKIRFRRGR